MKSAGDWYDMRSLIGFIWEYPIPQKKGTRRRMIPPFFGHALRKRWRVPLMNTGILLIVCTALISVLLTVSVFTLAALTGFLPRETEEYVNGCQRGRFLLTIFRKTKKGWIICGASFLFCRCLLFGELLSVPFPASLPSYDPRTIHKSFSSSCGCSYSHQAAFFLK